MANYKSISVSTLTGQTVYCMVKRDIDSYYLATNEWSFVVSAGYPAMTEDAAIKGVYTLYTNTIAWDNGTYTIAAYIQSGASPDPASDTCLGVTVMRIFEDAEVAPYIQMTGIGTGTIEVDHDYGSAGALSYLTSSGSGIQDADVLAYLTTDYAAGNTGEEYVRGATTTDVNGEWLLPMYLYAGAYTFVFKKDGEYGPDTIAIVVSDDPEPR